MSGFADSPGCAGSGAPRGHDGAPRLARSRYAARVLRPYALSGRSPRGDRGVALAGDPDFVALIRQDPGYPHEYALELVADISARLRSACSHFADDDYAALVLDVARTRVRFHRLDHQSGSLAGPQRLSG